MVESSNNIPEDMLNAIKIYTNDCAKILESFTKERDALPTPGTLFHYTDSAGLLGILNSGKIRLSDIFGLNDPSELRHGLSIASEILTNEVQGSHPAAELFVEKFISIDKGLETIGSFLITCFSCDGDDLGQWRAYGDDGKGFAIGFQGNLLDELFLKANANLYSNGTFHVSYDDSLLYDLHQQIIKIALPLITMPNGRKLDNDVINMFMIKLSSALAINVIFSSMGFKHQAYRAEQEYRFLQFRGKDKSVGDLKLRARGHSLINFTDFEWKTDDLNVLCEIVIGPAADGGAAHSFVRRCLIASGFDPDNVTVQQSKIPYRNM